MHKPKERIIPEQVARDRFGVGIQHHFVRIKSMAVFWGIRSVDPIPVDLARFRVGQITVPDLVCGFGKNDALRFLGRIRRVKQAELHLGGVFGKERKVDPHAVPSGSKWVGAAWPYAHFVHGCRRRKRHGNRSARLAPCASLSEECPGASTADCVVDGNGSGYGPVVLTSEGRDGTFLPAWKRVFPWNP